MGYLIIWFWNRDNLDTSPSTGYGVDMSPIIPIFFWGLYTIIWLVVFFVFDLNLPKIVLQ